MKQTKYLESTKLSMILFAFMFLLYAVACMTKSMFSSAMAVIVEEGSMTKSQTGLINAMFWLVYAFGQILGGFSVDRYSPHKLVMIGIGGSIVANLIIYFNQSYSVIMTVWTLSAVVQFGLWPGVFKIISTQISPKVRSVSVFWIMISGSVGVGLSLLSASFVSRWQQNFLVSIISMSVMLVLYIILVPFFNKKMVTQEVEHGSHAEYTRPEKKPMLPLMLSSGLIIWIVVSLFRCAIDNGIKMMTPVMLMESYDELPASIATRLSSSLVVFAVLGMLVSGFIRRSITRNEAKAQIILYFLCALPLIVVCFVGRIHYIFIIIALSAAVMLISSVTPFIQSYSVLHFEDYGRIGTVSGLLNSAASIGNILASYVFAKMSEVMSWQNVAISWVSVIAFCALLCIIVLPKWTRFTG